MKGLKLAFLNSRLLAVHNESIPLFDSFVYSHHLLLDNMTEYCKEISNAQRSCE